MLGERREIVNSHRVGSPEDEGEASEGAEQGADLVALAHGHGTAVNCKVPDDKEVRNAGNGIPAPLLGSALTAESGKETGQDHDEVGDDGQQGVATAKAGEQAKVEEEEGCGQAPVDVAGPVDLAEDVLERVGNVLVGLGDDNVVVADAVTSGHGKVGDGSSHDDQGGDDVVETLAL